MIARVAVDIPLPHLDRLFDYVVPETLASQAQPGVRVRVRFAGRLRDGYLIELAETSEVTGRLASLSKVVSAEPVLGAAQYRLLRRVADHYAGTFADVVRLAVPPRHAATEAADQADWPAPRTARIPSGGLLTAPNGTGFLTSLERGSAARAYWQVPPRFYPDQYGSDDWTRGFAQAAIAALRSGRDVIIVLPDIRDLTRIRSTLADFIGLGAIAELHSDLGPALRYRNYLAVRRGQARVVVGARPAVYAPVRDLGLICLWDDGDDLHADPHTPYPHARDVAALRAAADGCGLLLAGHARTAEVQSWLDRDWLGGIGLVPGQQRRACAAVRVSGDSDQALARDPLARSTRLPRIAFETIRTGLLTGPVLVQVPRAGYLPALTCRHCHTPVRCPTCHGPVRVRRTAGSRQLDCTWCGRIIVEWRCITCGGRELRAPVVGSERTTEELGRAFPGIRVLDSSGDRVISHVGDQPALVVATPGAEPLPGTGYAAAVLLDAHRLLERPDLRAGEEALRRWLNAMALVRPASDGGTVCVVGPPAERAIQALVRLDPGGYAIHELADRIAAGYPPAVRFITIEGVSGAVAEFGDLLTVPEGTERLGPVELGVPVGVGQEETWWQLSLRVPTPVGTELIRAVKAAAAGRTARKLTGALRIRVDPVRL